MYCFPDVTGTLAYPTQILCMHQQTKSITVHNKKNIKTLHTRHDFSLSDLWFATDSNGFYCILWWYRWLDSGLHSPSSPFDAYTYFVMRCYENVEIAHHNIYMGWCVCMWAYDCVFRTLLPLFFWYKIHGSKSKHCIQWHNNSKTRSLITHTLLVSIVYYTGVCAYKIMNKSCWWHGIHATQQQETKPQTNTNAIRHFAFTFVFIFGDHKQVHLFTISIIVCLP